MCTITAMLQRTILTEQLNFLTYNELEGIERKGSGIRIHLTFLVRYGSESYTACRSCVKVDSQTAVFDVTKLYNDRSSARPIVARVSQPASTLLSSVCFN